MSCDNLKIFAASDSRANIALRQFEKYPNGLVPGMTVVSITWGFGGKDGMRLTVPKRQDSDIHFVLEGADKREYLADRIGWWWQVQVVEN